MDSIIFCSLVNIGRLNERRGEPALKLDVVWFGVGKAECLFVGWRRRDFFLNLFFVLIFFFV